MKKRLSLLLLIVLVLPIFALIGCGSTTTYAVSLFCYDTYGTAYGYGSYEEGKSVTLTANAKPNCYFVGWVKENTILLQADEIYSITNTQNSQSKIGSSSLSFTMSAATAGKYTAVFEKDNTSDSIMDYIKLSSLRFVTTKTAEGEPEESQTPIMTTTMSILEGSSTSLNKIYEAEELHVMDNAKIDLSSNRNVMRFNGRSPQSVSVRTFSIYKENPITLNFYADINFKQSTERTEVANQYAYEVIFANGTYTVVFSYNLDAETVMNLILEYKNLA